MSVVRFIDRPCGFGKTTDMLNGLTEGELYLIVVPSLTEVARVLAARPDMNFVAPSADDWGSKSRHLKELIYGANNVVCTHALYHLNVEFYGEGYLANYNIIIDEVLDVVETITPPKQRSWQEFYVEAGFVSIEGDGRILPTKKWHELHKDVDDSLSDDLYQKASSGCLYTFNKKFLLWSVAPELVQAGKSCTVMSFKVRGSLMAMYLERMGIDYVVEVVDGEEDQLRARFRALCDVRCFDVGIPLSNTGQLSASQTKKSAVATKLRWLKSKSEEVRSADGLLLTCAKSNWVDGGDFSKGSRLADSATWIPNTTRGTNDYKHCDVAIYLWDQYLNPAVKQFLGADNHQEEQYAVSELLQWVYRTRIRDGKPIILYLPSKRMTRLLQKWVEEAL